MRLFFKILKFSNIIGNKFVFYFFYKNLDTIID